MNRFEKILYMSTSVILLVIIIFMITALLIIEKPQPDDMAFPDEQRIDTIVTPSETEEEVADDDSATDEQTTYDDYVNTIKSHMDTINGDCQWGFYLFGDDTGYSTESYAVPSASIIKVFIMEYAFSLTEKGELSLADNIQGTPLETLIYNMITVSDNDATNILISEFGMDNLNSYFKENGYIDTVVQRKMLDTAAQNAGLDNYTSLNDVMSFLKKLYAGKDSGIRADMLEIMKNQQVSTKIRRNFGSGTVIANKTGELSNVDNDIGIIFGENGDMAVAFLCSNLTDTASAKNAIANAAYDLAADTIMENGR